MLAKRSKEAAVTIKNKDDFTYHHLAIPSNEPRAGEVHDPVLKSWSVPGTNNAYGIEWTRFEDDSDCPEILREFAHVTFEVDVLTAALNDETVIVDPYESAPGIQSAFIEVLGAPVRLLQIDKAIAGESAANPVQLSGKNLEYHHTGMPANGHWDDEIKVPHLKLAYLPGKYNTYGVEWLRFEEGNENPDIIKYIPHVAFEVDDIDQAVVGEKVIYHSGKDDPAIYVAMIEVDGASIEFLQLDRSICGDQYNR